MEITALKGIGEKTAELFHKLHVYTAEDLVHYYPRDYEYFSDPVDLIHAGVNEMTAVSGKIRGNIATRHVRGLSITSFEVECVGGGTLHMTYFNMPYLKNSLKRDILYIFRGILQLRGSRYVMEQARMYKPEEYGKMAAHMLPRYSTTKGLSNNAVTKAMRQAITAVNLSDDYLPEHIREEEGLYSLEDAVKQMHFPESRDSLVKARERLVFDEFLLFILMIRRMRDSNEEISNQYPMIDVAQTKRLIEALPYNLTKAQHKVWTEIQNDLTSEHTMNRLIQGDVGSGKTILAFLSLIMCVANGYQGAMMAPTEVLATQHYETLIQMQKKYKLPIHPVLLTGSTSAKDRKSIYAQIESGEANIILGTHALIQDKVIYRNLALVITDEQHRFGVRQRESLAQKGNTVHVLVMSATPIPRTLAIILYGDLHISVLDELPANRLPIKNCVVNTSYRETAYRFIEKEVSAGHQVYVICPMVDEGEAEELENVVSYTAKLKGTMNPSVQIAALHGRMKAAEKKRIMEAFAARRIDVLVSTTVIEVGINVPNATVMMVENAERFGLAQLHQLRGRVGRGDEQSYCIFVSGSQKPETMARLKILNESNDGFYIASQDLKLRGPGDLFGIRQSGDIHFALGDIYQDAGVLQRASDRADMILSEEAFYKDVRYALLRERLEHAAINEVDFRTI
ncbi:MAG: ATP-dependent DNA helicase RecG [Lachnospiraceae bacterium]|nr:ATP-dependent DNA helicase RecG [Lachnospiraceae bacterium]